ncbi:TPA: hypothetical protein HA318_00960 [Candidatus Micrarchaeota archaeon]|nr:hypothetical protein [Candidatus Micrarchaeota archaeon]
MNGKLLNVVTLALAILLTIGVCNALTLQSHSFSPSTLKPGTTGSINIVIQNAGTEYISSATLSAIGTGLAFSGSTVIGDIGSSGSTSIAVPFVVKSGAKTGSYATSITIAYTSNAYSSSTSGASRYITFSVPYTISSTTGLEMTTLSVSPTTVSPGDRLTIRVKIRNTGGKVRSLSIVPNGDFALAGVSQLQIAELSEGQEIEQDIPLIASTTLATGLQSVSLALTYEDASSTEKTESFSLGPIAISEKTPSLMMTVFAPNASPGSRTTITVKVTNAGERMLENTRISLQTSAFFVPLEYSEKTVGNLAARESKDATFLIGISPSSNPAYYALSFLASYDAGKGTETETKILGIDVHGNTELELVASTNPTPLLTTTKSGSLSIQVANRGDAVVRALSVAVDSPIIEAIDAPSNYIGNLEVDDYSASQFAIITKNNLSPGTYPVRVTIKYKDFFNTPREETSELQITVFTPESVANTQSGDNTGWTVAILVIVLVAAYWGYRKFFHKKKHGTLNALTE